MTRQFHPSPLGGVESEAGSSHRTALAAPGETSPTSVVPRFRRRQNRGIAYSWVLPKRGTRQAEIPASYKPHRSVTSGVFEAALRYPTNGETAVERLLIGGVLILLSVFVLPIFLVYGYLVRSLAAVAAGDEEPPAFDEWAELFVDGLKVFVVGFVYGIVPVALAVAFFVPVSVTTAVASDRPSGVLTGVGVLAFFVLLVIGLAVAYVIMAALSHFAVEGRFGAAFEFGAIGRFATSESYVVAIVLAIVLQVIVSAVIVAVVVFTLGLALFVLIPLGAFVNFWTYLVTVHLFGAAYSEAMGEPSA